MCRLKYTHQSVNCVYHAGRITARQSHARVSDAVIGMKVIVSLCADIVTDVIL
jgi:hypothetical protein